MSLGCIYIYLMPFIYDDLQMISFAYFFLSYFLGSHITHNNYSTFPQQSVVNSAVGSDVQTWYLDKPKPVERQ